MNFSKHDGPFSLKSQAHVPSTLPIVKSPPSLGSLLMRCVSALFILLKHCHLEKAARESKTSLPFPNISLGAKNNFVGFPFRNIEAERFRRECNWCNCVCLFGCHDACFAHEYPFDLFSLWNNFPRSHPPSGMTVAPAFRNAVILRFLVAPLEKRL